MARVTVPVAELMAFLGADTRNLDDALLSSSIKLENFSDRVLTSQQLLKELSDVGFLTARNFQDVGTALQLLSEQYSKNIETERLKAESDAEVLRMSQLKQQALEDELAKQVEYTSLVKQLKEEEREAEERLLEEYERANEEMTRLDVERIAAMEAQQRAMQSSLPFLSNYGGGSGGGGGGGGGASGAAGVRLGSGGLSPYFRLTEGISSVIGPAMDIIFPIALITLGIDLIKQYALGMEHLVDTITGAAEASRELEASSKALFSAVERQADFLTQVDRIAKKEGKSPQSVEAEISKITTPATRLIDAQMGPMAAERNNLSQIIQQLKGVPPGGRDIAARFMGQHLGMTGYEGFTVEGITKRKDELDKDILSLTEKKLHVQMDEVRIMDQHTTSLKRMTDRVHEFTTTARLPWFLGPTPADSLATALHAAGPGGVHPFNAITRFTAPVATSALTAPSFSAGSPVGSKSSSSSGGSGVVLEVHNTINYKFEGVPADVQKFVREQMEPRLLMDMDTNTRGLTKKMVDALRKAGVKVG